MRKFELITLAMYILDGGNKALDIEDIAMECEKLAPGVFGWRKYKDQINLELVGFAVRDAKKKAYGQRVSGSHAKGWRLTSEGILLAKELLDKDEQLKTLNVQPTKSRNLEVTRASAEIKRVIESRAFKNWSESGESTESQLSQLLRINAYSDQESINIKIARLTKLLDFEQSNDINEFIKYVISIKEGLYE